MIYLSNEKKEPVLLTPKSIDSLKHDKLTIRIIPNSQYAIITDAPPSETQVTSPFSYFDPTTDLTYYFFSGRTSSYHNEQSVIDMPLEYNYKYLVDSKDTFPISKKTLTLLSASTDRKDFNLPFFDPRSLLATSLLNGLDERKVGSKILEAYSEHITFFENKIYIFPSTLSAAASLFDDDQAVWHELTEDVAERLVHYFEPNASSKERNEVVKFIYLELSKSKMTHIYNPDWVLFNNNIIYDTNPEASTRTIPYDPKSHFFTRVCPVPYLDDATLLELKPNKHILNLLDALSRRNDNPDSLKSKLVNRDLSSYVGLLLTDKKYDISLFLTGTGGNGKSQFIKFIRRLIPSSQIISTNNLINESSYPTIASKRLLILEEINKLDRIQEGQVIDAYKTISGMDSLSFRKFYTHNVIDVTHRVQIMITANTIVPGFYADESTIRRFKVVNSEKKVKEIARDTKSYAGESVTDVAKLIETDDNLTWYANWSVRNLLEDYTKDDTTHTPTRPVDKMFEDDTSVYIANKHPLVSRLLKGFRNQKVIKNMYDFNLFSWRKAGDTKYVKSFIDTILKYSPEKLFEFHAPSETMPDSDRMNHAVTLIFERVIIPRNSFKLEGNSLYDDSAKIKIINPNVQYIYDESKGRKPKELEFDALNDFTKFTTLTSDKVFKALETRKNDIIRAQSYLNALEFDMLLEKYDDFYSEKQAEIVSNIDKIDEYML